MFSFPEGPEPTSTAAPELGERARLVIEVPHWTAVIAVTDNDLRPAEGLSKLEPLADSGDAAFAVIELPAGAYSIEARLGGNNQSLWVVAAAGHETRVPVEMWNSLSLATSMPLATPIDGLPADDPLVATAHERSQESVPAPALDAGTATEARLFLFGRLAQASGQDPAAWDIELLDEAGKSVAKLTDQPPRVEPTSWSSTFDLPKGYYVLRARETSQRETDPKDPKSQPPRTFYRCQPLYLCAGWEGHVFLECDQSPRLATMAFNMGRMGTGFRPDDDATIAAAAVLAALGNDCARETVVGTAKMEQLLRGEMHNPWLGVLAAYALATAPEDAPGLLAEVKAFLVREIGDHPDVRALTLDKENLVRLDYPPMLRAGLRRVRSGAEISSESAIVADSALSRVGQRLAADSAWTAWIEEMTPQLAGDAPPGIATPMQVLGRALSSSAPIYPLTPTGDPSPTLTTKSFAEQVAIIEEAESVLNTYDGSVKPSVKVAAGGSVGDLLKVDAAMVSQFAGTDAKTVEEGYRHLSGSLGEIESLDQDSARTMQHVLASIFDVKRWDAVGSVAESAADKGRQEQFYTPIEDHVATLHQEARRLRTLSARTQPPTDAELEQAEALAAKLDEQAERLAAHAHLVIIADEAGRLLFGNKLLHDRLQARIDPQDVIERLQRGLSGGSDDHFQVPARELSPTSPEGQQGTMVDIDRTVVRDESDAVQAYIYLLRNAHARNLGAKAAHALDSLLPVLTLHAATAQHGEAAPTSSLEAIDALTNDLDEILG